MGRLNTTGIISRKYSMNDTTKESWKEKLDIVQAFSNGKDIEAKAGDGSTAKSK